MLYEIVPQLVRDDCPSLQDLLARKGAERTRTAVSALTPHPYESFLTKGGRP